MSEENKTDDLPVVNEEEDGRLKLSELPEGDQALLKELRQEEISDREELESEKQDKPKPEPKTVEKTEEKEEEQDPYANLSREEAIERVKNLNKALKSERNQKKRFRDERDEISAYNRKLVQMVEDGKARTVEEADKKVKSGEEEWVDPLKDPIGALSDLQKRIRELNKADQDDEASQREKFRYADEQMRVVRQMMDEAAYDEAVEVDVDPEYQQIADLVVGEREREIREGLVRQNVPEQYHEELVARQKIVDYGKLAVLARRQNLSLPDVIRSMANERNLTPRQQREEDRQETGPSNKKPVGATEEQRRNASLSLSRTNGVAAQDITDMSPSEATEELDGDKFDEYYAKMRKAALRAEGRR